MNRVSLALITAAAAMLVACGDGTSDTLTNGTSQQANGDPNATAGGPDTTFNHSNDPAAADPTANQNATDVTQVKLVGSPEVTSRLHSCGKMTVNSLNQLLTSRGIGGKGAGRPAVQQGQPANDAPNILKKGAAALGQANYNGRVPEAPFASTSALSKEFDIFTMASYDVVDANWTAPACPGIKVLGTDGKFTKDGLSCLMGKPARDEHVAIANDAIAKNPTDGAKIAIAAILSAAHTCE